LPAVNPLPTSTGSQSPLTQLIFANSLTVNGSTDYWEFGIFSSNANGETVVSGTSYYIGTVGFNVASNASGVWNVYAVQQPLSLDSPLAITYWLQVPATESSFGNLLNDVRESLPVGTITVAAVPEPSTAGLGAASIVRRRNWCQRGRVEPKKESKTAFSGSHGVGV
jgi:hypothetical protein